MKGKELREALRSGRRVYGTLVVSDSPMWPTTVGQMSELDFVFIDTEHQAIDRSKLSWMCRTYDAMGLAPKDGVFKSPYDRMTSEYTDVHYQRDGVGKKSA